MKTWLFALLQSLIACLGFLSYFWAENVMLTTMAAVLAAGLGVAQPLISARKSRKLEAYQDRQYQKSFDAVDEQLKGLLAETSDPPLPHRATVRAVVRRCAGERANELMDEYDRLTGAVAAGRPAAEALASLFREKMGSRSIGPYLEGLAAMAHGDLKAAHAHFSAAKDAQTNWVAPWLGWAATLYSQGRIEELRENHPHIRGVELLPYDSGDELTFLQLSEDERQELTELFQRTASSLGNYYAIAELFRSRQQLAASRDEFKKAA